MLQKHDFVLPFYSFQPMTTSSVFFSKNIDGINSIFCWSVNHLCMYIISSCLVKCCNLNNGHTWLSSQRVSKLLVLTSYSSAEQWLHLTALIFHTKVKIPYCYNQQRIYAGVRSTYFHSLSSYDQISLASDPQWHSTGTSELPDMFAWSPKAYISAKSQVSMSQLICT